LNTEAQVGLPARRAAVRLLGSVLRDLRPFDDVFHDDAENGLLKSFAARDRALVHLIVATALRRKGQIEDALSRFMQKPLPARSGNASEVLLTGAAQLMFLQTPPHAAIDLALRTADLDRRARGYKKVINAVLRRVSENMAEIMESQDAEKLNTPDWLWHRWTEAYGEDQARAIARAHAHEPSLDLTVRRDAPAWAERLDGHLMPTGTIRLTAKGRIERIEGYDEGAWWVQDAAAALPARLLGNVEGKPVLDLCAAPGGKTAQLAAAGADVTAIDHSEKRLERLAANLTRLDLKARTETGDALAYQPASPPDAILLDAPCSATGTIRRHADIPYVKTAEMIAEQAAVQRRMLERAIDMLAPGGLLVFCTCSLEPEEGEQHASAVPAEGAGVERVPVTPAEIGGLAEAITPKGDVRTLPFHYETGDPATSGLDGFFITRLKKI